MSRPRQIVDHILNHPGCIEALYDPEDQPLIKESELLDESNWVLEDPDEPDFWMNENTSFCEGIRACFFAGSSPTFEGL